MPEADLHYKQYQHNYEILQSPLFRTDNTENLDWAITLVFYCAVHLVEKVLADIDHPYHSDCHRNRGKAVNRFKKLKKISAEYQALYNQSIRARYNCVRFKKQDIEEALMYLEHIKTALVC